jgi:septation ring formation regulator EzrA
LQTLIERQVTAALGDLRSRLVTVERKSTSVTTQQDPDSAKLTRLAAMMHSFGEMVKEIESSVDQRQTDIEQRYAELAEYITDNNIKVMKLAGKLHGAMQALEADDEGKAA